MGKKRGRKPVSRRGKSMSLADLGKAFGVEPTAPTMQEILGKGSADPLSRDAQGRVYAPDPVAGVVIHRRTAPVVEAPMATIVRKSTTPLTVAEPEPTAVLTQAQVDALRELSDDLRDDFTPDSYFNRNAFRRFFEDLKAGMGWDDIEHGVTSLLSRSMKKYNHKLAFDFIDLLGETVDKRRVSTEVRSALNLSGYDINGPSVDIADFDRLMSMAKAHEQGADNLPKPVCQHLVSSVKVGSTGRGHWGDDGYISSESIMGYRVTKTISGFMTREDEEVHAFISWYQSTKANVIAGFDSRVWDYVDYWAAAKDQCQGRKAWTCPLHETTDQPTDGSDYWIDSDDSGEFISGFDNSGYGARWAASHRTLA